MSQFTFSNPIVARRIRLFEAAAKAHVQRDWYHRPWHWYEANSRPDYRLSTGWSNTEKDATHWISLSCDGPKGHSFDFSARLVPPACRWDLHVSYSENWHGDRQVQEHFMLTICDRQRYPTAAQPLFMIPCDSFGFSERFGQYEYAVGVNLNENNLPLGTAATHLSSAERLQGALLAACDQLESQAKAQIASGDGMLVLDHSKMVEPRQTTSIPVPLPLEPTRIKPPLPTTYLPTAEQKELMLARMSAEMAVKRQFIRDHAAEVHASLERAFPLGQLLKKLENSSLSP